MPEIYGSDAFSPREVARKVEDVGVSKARAPFIETSMLGILAGGFVGLGGLYFTLVTAGAGPDTLQPGIRVLGGIVFAIGYVIAILSGTEVFTSNNLLVMSWAARKISAFDLLRNWLLILAANGIGAFGLALVFVYSGLPGMNEEALGKRALEIAVQKVTLPFGQVFFLGVLGNLFVCIAVWISMEGRSVTDKILALMLPLSALGALNLEHVLATLYFIPRAMLMQLVHPEITVAGIEALTFGAFLKNLLAVTLGNIVGGTFMVALVYHVVYRLNPREDH